MPHETLGEPELEELAWHWRKTLDAAHAALAASAYDRGFAPVGRRELKHLADERTSVARALDGVSNVHRFGVSLGQVALGPSDLYRVLGLPKDITLAVFNLDGVLVPSAALHAAAWREAFDAFLFERHERTRGEFRPFDPVGEYYRYLHGRPRLEGVREFLASRGIRLPEGDPGDPAGAETVHGLANRKGGALDRRLAAHRLAPLAGSMYYLEAAREAGIHRVAVSASANAPEMVEQAGLAPLVEALVDGSTMEAERLRAAPAPDTLLAAAGEVEADPGHAVAFETTAAGIAAAREAGFELVIGVGAETRGADRVVSSLGELLGGRSAP